MTRPSNSPRQMRLGLFVQPLGHHVSGWRLTQRLGSPTDIDWLISIAKKAEEGTFDMFFVGDALATTVCRPPWHALSR
jgi:alkanesulfonate monooxygenase SsuD/methylene tetrahydromethanopterin reductase-like flavin-dependent oxidoreductase (luciferase family)